MSDLKENAKSFVKQIAEKDKEIEGLNHNIELQYYHAEKQIEKRNQRIKELEEGLEIMLPSLESDWCADAKAIALKLLNK